MKTLPLAVSAGVLVLLAVIYVAQQNALRITTLETGTVSLLPDLDPGQVFEMRLSRTGGERSLVLRKVGGSWIFPNHYGVPANRTRVEAFLKGLVSLQGELRASEEELLPVFHLREDQAWTLELIGEGGRLLEGLLLGKRGPEAYGVFVRGRESSRVHLADNNLLAQFGIHGDEGELPEDPVWVDTALLDFPRNRWRRVEFSWRERSIAFESLKDATGGLDDLDASAATGREAGWKQTFPDSPVMDEDRISALLDTLARMRAVKVAPYDPKESSVDPREVFRVHILLDDDTSVQLQGFREEPDGAVLVRRDSAGYAYRISGPVWDPLFEPFEKLSSKQGM